MIYTRFGTPAKLLDLDKDDEGVWVKWEYLEKPELNREERESHISDFIADDGFTEIIEALREVSKPDVFADVFPNAA
jgi:hypothetical protein